MSSLTGNILKHSDDSANNKQANNSGSLLNGGDTLEIKSDQNNIIRRIFKKYIKQKIEQEYEIYFKSLLKEAKDSYSGGTHDVYANKSNIRELVGLRVGLEFLKSNKDIEEQQRIH